MVEAARAALAKEREALASQEAEAKAAASREAALAEKRMVEAARAALAKEREALAKAAASREAALAEKTGSRKRPLPTSGRSSPSTIITLDEKWSYTFDDAAAEAPNDAMRAYNSALRDAHGPLLASWRADDKAAAAAAAVDALMSHRQRLTETRDDRVPIVFSLRNGVRSLQLGRFKCVGYGGYKGLHQAKKHNSEEQRKHTLVVGAVGMAVMELYEPQAWTHARDPQHPTGPTPRAPTPCVARTGTLAATPTSPWTT